MRLRSENAPLRTALFAASALSVLMLACSAGGDVEVPPTGAARERRTSPQASPSILLLTIDTWRWDYLGASGSGKVRTPNLDDLARGGLYYRKAQTPCPLTTPAHATLLTGRTPLQHGIRDNLHFRLKEGVPTLATALGKAGYHTVAVVAGSPLRRLYGLDRGFSEYDDSGLGPSGEESFTPSSHTAPEVVERALALLDHAPASSPLFAWVHFYDPHHPYVPPEPFARQYASDPYAGEVALVDQEVGRLLSAVRARRPGPWVVVVVGDHGEGLGDHGEATHGVGLYESTLEVPLIFYPRPEGCRSGGPAALVDVAPTLLGLAGVPALPGDGVDLRVGAPPDRWISSESAFPALSFGVNPVLALRRGDLIWFHHGADEVYDLASDPAQVRDLAAGTGREFVREATPHLATAFGADPGAALFRTSLALSPGDLTALRGLGYLDGGLPANRNLTRTDIRAFLTAFSRLNEARRLFVRGEYAEAAGRYEDFLSRYARSSLAWRELGSCALARNEMDRAREAFSKALALDPSDAVAALNLGNLAAMAGDSAGAEKLYRRSLAAEEAQPQAHLNLGVLYAQVLSRPADAAPHLRRFLELAPNDPEADKVRQILKTEN